MIGAFCSPQEFIHRVSKEESLSLCPASKFSNSDYDYPEKLLSNHHKFWSIFVGATSRSDFAPGKCIANLSL